jgi:hypothetical protein
VFTADLSCCRLKGESELYKGNNPDATGILAEDHHHFDEVLSERYPSEKFPDEAVRSDLFQAEAVKFIRNNPQRFAELCWIRFGQFWKLYSPRVPLSNSLVVIASFGIALPFFPDPGHSSGMAARRGNAINAGDIVSDALHMVFTSIVRYRLLIEPLVVVLAIAGFQWTVETFPMRSVDFHPPNAPMAVRRRDYQGLITVIETSGDMVSVDGVLYS